MLFFMFIKIGYFFCNIKFFYLKNLYKLNCIEYLSKNYESIYF